MSESDASLKTHIQGKLFDLALFELVKNYRESFKPLWSTDSWVKFLIFLALRSGLSGEQEAIGIFVKALGNKVTSKMRRVFFERRLEAIGLLVMADPAEKQVLIMPMNPKTNLTKDQAAEAIEAVGLEKRTIPDQTNWKQLDSLIAIPWKID